METSTKVANHRNVALDFTKGALVLIMVLYHWLNYFVSGGDFYKYLRFLTPSFICISGFLISSVYFSKYNVADPKLPKRLVQRGLKILAVFILLNVGISLMFRSSYTMGDLSAANLKAIFITGNVLVAGIGKAASFYVLVPISYLLFLSAALVIVSRFYRYTFQVALVAGLLSVLVLDLNGLQSGNLELLTIGLLGVVLGFIPPVKIDHLVMHPYALAIAYFCYAAAVTRWDVPYPLQIVGVCVNLMVIYALGLRDGEPSWARSQVILLGKYSLLGYIGQIIILQFLRMGFRLIKLGSGTLEISFIAAVALVVIFVAAVDRARTQSSTVNTLYKAVFA